MQKLTLTLLLLFGFIFLAGNLQAQMPISSLDYDKVPQKKIRHFLFKQKLNGINDFADMYATCYTGTDSVDYFEHSSEYTIDIDSDKLWELYTQLDPQQIYSGRRIEFGFMYSQLTNQFIYPGDPYEGLKIGQVYFMSLHLLWGLLDLGMAQEINKIDQNSRTLQYCYLKHGKAEGSQEIQLIDLGNEKTKIRHLTHYRSDSMSYFIILP